VIFPRSDLPLDRDQLSRFLPWLIAFMVFLSVLAVAGMLVLNATASKWDRGVRGTMTVQVVPTDDQAKDEARLNEVLIVLATSPEIERYDALDDSRLIRLLEPWVGTAASSGELPLPRLIDVELKISARLSAAELNSRITEKVNGVNIDDHRVWLDHLVRLIETFEALAMVVLLFIVLATVGTIVFTTRTGLSIHREAIEVLHLIGAHDSYIARQFARRALGLGLSGGVVGLLLAVPTLWGLAHLARSLDDRLLPDIGFGPMHWGLLAALPVGVSLVAMVTAKITVMRSLERML
jgi:cell division transport system permease protein